MDDQQKKEQAECLQLIEELKEKYGKEYAVIFSPPEWRDGYCKVWITDTETNRLVAISCANWILEKYPNHIHKVDTNGFMGAILYIKVGNWSL